MEVYKKLSIALLITFTIPMLIPGRTIQYYLLKFTRRWRSRSSNGEQNKSNKKNYLGNSLVSSTMSRTPNL